MEKKNISPKLPTQEDYELGLAAIGVSDVWEIAVDETLTGPQKYFVQIEGPAVSIYFEIDSPAIVDKALSFLQDRCSAPDKKSDSIRLGQFRQMPVYLIRDNEFEGRFFFAIGRISKPALRLTFWGDPAQMLKEALQQVRDELESSDLLSEDEM